MSISLQFGWKVNEFDHFNLLSYWEWYTCAVRNQKQDGVQCACVDCSSRRTQTMQNDIEYYKGHLRHQQTLNDCLRKDLDDLRRQNSTLKWKKCDLEREIVRLNSTAECLRQRVRSYQPCTATSTLLRPFVFAGFHCFHIHVACPAWESGEARMEAWNKKKLRCRVKWRYQLITDR